MRWIWVATVLVAVGPGCSTSKTAGPDAALAMAKVRKTAPPPASRSRTDAEAAVSPDKEWLGRVVWANPVLRFVVMDFPVSKMPPVDQHLNVYRAGQKIGEVKVTGPMRDTSIAGDIIAGEAEVGDEVREQ